MYQDYLSPTYPQTLTLGDYCSDAPTVTDDVLAMVRFLNILGVQYVRCIIIYKRLHYMALLT